jgi:hypothetical protein
MSRERAAIVPALLAFVLCSYAATPRTDAERQVIEATREVQQMKSDPKVRELLARAQAVFILPDGPDGLAVMVAKRGALWEKPALYDIGDIRPRLLAQRIAFILMKAGNIVLWSARKGARTDAHVALSGLRLDEPETRAFYRSDPRAPDTAAALRKALSD